MTLDILKKYEDRFFIIKGDIKTHSILLDGSKSRFDLLLNRYLKKELKYDIVGFIDVRGLYFLDQESRNHAMIPKSMQKNNKTKNTKLLKRRQNIRVTTTASTGSLNLKMRYGFNNGFSFLIETILNTYKNKALSTAIILYDDSNLSKEVNTKAFEQLTGFLRTDLKVLTTKGIFIVVEDGDYLNITQKYHHRNWNGFFSFQDGKLKGTAKIIDISLPTEDELKTLITRERLLYNKDIDISDIKKLSKILLAYSRENKVSIQTIERELKNLEYFNIKNFKDIFNKKYKDIPALEQLNSMIGLKNIKTEINNILDGVNPVKRIYIKNKGSIISNRFFSVDKSNLPDLEHLVFSGNPGTGKTEVAKLVGEILKEKGILESGHLVKVTAKDLVAGYVAQTAPKTYEKIKEASGGVLFIDEAYSLMNNKNGQEAIDTLVEAMTDLSGEFIVIFAGYKQDMESLIDSNPGLQSRIKNIFFEDYNSSELSKIMEFMFNNRKLDISNIKDKFESYCKNLLYKNSSNKNWGNAREIKKIISNTTRKLNKEKKNIVEFNDVENSSWFHKDNKEIDPESLENMVGLSSVKNEIQKIKDRIEYDSSILKLKTPARNYIFIGNPGTGKTTVAKQMANILYNLGVLRTNKIINKTAKDFIGNYQGDTEDTTKKILKQALGGVLFIDEAHQLGSDSNLIDGKKVIETIVPFMTDHKGEFSIILGGYPDKMKKMLDIDQGFTGRFTETIIFEDYNGKEMLEIFNTKIHKKINKNKDIDIILVKAFNEMQAFMKKNFANARTALNFYDKIIDILAKNKRTEVLEQDIINVLNNIKREFNISTNNTNPSLLLNNMIGLNNVKSEINLIKKRIQLDKKLGKKVIARNYLFVGNPGTGKTTVAKQIANIFYDLGLLKTNEITEITASELIGRYKGDTENNTREVLTRSIGGLLFIDEAHQLYSSAPNADSSYGLQVIKTLVPFMTQNIGKFSIIMAGYKKPIEDMLKSSDPGLKGRFTKTIEFQDYTKEEMLEIFNKKLEFPIENNIEETLLNIFKKIKNMMKDSFANARTVNDFYDRLIDVIAEKDTKNILITKKDLNSVLSKMKEEYEN